MYNINDHYKFIYSIAVQCNKDVRVVYLHPFGSSAAENIEVFTRDFSQGFVPGPVILCYDQEPLIPDFNKNLFLHIKRMYKGMPVILLNTESDSEAKDKILTQFKFIDCYSFFHIFAAHDWFRGNQFNPAIVPVSQRVITKRFVTLNRITSGARIYRTVLIAKLAAADLLDQGHISWSRMCPAGSVDALVSLEASAQCYGIADSTVYECNAALTGATTMQADFGLESEIPSLGFFVGTPEIHNTSFVNVVTETCFWESKNHLTEKIFKPIVLQQPFLLVGCAHNLAYLRSYGFKTFDQWWDESYDSIKDPIQRLNAVVDIIADICKKSDTEIQSMLMAMEETLEYNRALFFSSEFLQNAVTELTENLHQALNCVGNS